MSEQTERNKKNVLEALEKSFGVVTTACKNAGVGRTQFYQWLKDDKEFKEKVDDIQNIALDMAESQLHKQIITGNTTATIFYLRPKARTEDTLNGTSIQGLKALSYLKLRL